MEDVNPYASPQSDARIARALAEPGRAVWREGDLLVMRENAVLPDRCIKCNAPRAAAKAEVRLHWADPIVRPQQSAECAHRQD